MARKSRKHTAYMPESTITYYRTALYIRLSVEDGNGRSNSVENQELILNDFTSDKPEFKVCGVYTDNGQTGLNYDRPAFQRLLNDIESGNINCIIVKDLSRLGRNAIDTGYYIQQYFPQHKVRFIAVNDNFDSDDKDSSKNGIIVPLKNMVNEAYALDIGKKIKAAAHQAMIDGEFIGARAPFGYLKDQNNCHKLIIDEVTAPIVKLIFDLFANGVGINPIVIKLNEMGIAAPSQYKSETSENDKQYKKSRNWNSITIHHILKNEVYMGDMVQGKSTTTAHKQKKADESEYIIVRDTHEPIVSRELFEKARQLLAANADKSRNKETNPYSPNIFKCSLLCPHCGRRLHRQRGRTTKKGENYYFICLSKSRVSKNACIGVHINEAELTEAVSQAISDEISALGLSFSALLSGNTTQKASDDLKTMKAAKQRELNKVQGLIRGLYESLVQGIITSEDYIQLKSDYEKQTNELKSQIEALSVEISDITKQEEHYKSVSEAFQDSNGINAELIERLIEQIEVTHDHEITIIFKSGRQYRKERT